MYQLQHDIEKFGVVAIHPLSLQALHIAAHIDAIDGQIMPALRGGCSIVLDRFWWSTWVYGLVSGVNRRALKAILRAEKMHWAGTQPTAVFIITRDRSLRPDEPLDRWKKLSAAYNDIGLEQQSRHPVIFVRNEGSVEEALGEILELIAPSEPEHQSRRRRTTLVAQHPLCRDPGADSPTEVLGRCGPEPREDVAQLLLGFSSDNDCTAPLCLPPTLLMRLAPVQPSEVLDIYWRFAAERQAIFFQRLEGVTPPWTQNLILRRHKFTNAYRAADRVSQYLIRHVIYEGDPAPQEVFFRTLLFKIFNRIETWEALQRELGIIRHAEYQFGRYDAVLTGLLAAGEPIFSAAYIMPSRGQQFDFTKKHRNYLQLIEQMMADRVPERLAELNSMEEAFALLRSYPMIGSFLAYQYVTDLNYSELTCFSEMEFAVPGPGARDGIHKCFCDLGGRSEADIIRMMAEHQEEEFARLGLEFHSLWGRPLQLIDCQNLFCEVDKYTRLAHPHIKGISGRTRIKQVYQHGRGPINYWFPPKWGLNEKIAGGKGQHVPAICGAHRPRSVATGRNCNRSGQRCFDPVRARRSNPGDSSRGINH